MKTFDKITGTLIASVFCIVTIPTAFLLPVIQMKAVFQSTEIHDFVKEHLVDANSPDSCSKELFWINFIYLGFSFLLSLTFYFLLLRKKINLIPFFVLILVQFYVLQTPFFIFEVGTYYNCESDGQTILGIISSSLEVSFLMIPFGILFDIIKHKTTNIKKT